MAPATPAWNTRNDGKHQIYYGPEVYGSTVGCHAECVHVPRLGSQQPKTPRASRRLTQRDLGWAAGFIEGDGCFTTNNHSISVSVAQNEREPLEKLVELLGGKIGTQGSMYLRPIPSRNAKQRDGQYIRKQLPLRWAVYGARAHGVMLTLFSLLHSRRREQIKRVLSAPAWARNKEH